MTSLADLGPSTDSHGSVGVGVGAEEFKRAFRHHPGGVVVVTADAGEGPAALTLTSLASVSAEPPIVIFSVSDLSSATPTVLAAPGLVVHMLDATDADVAKLAATHGADRFPAGAWDRMPTGEPYYPTVSNRLRCRIIDTLRAGTSTVVVALVLGATELPDDVATPLVYVDRAWHRLGDHSKL